MWPYPQECLRMVTQRGRNNKIIDHLESSCTMEHVSF